MKEFENSNRYLRATKQYIIYQINLYDTIKQRSDLRKQKITIRYNREIRAVTHHIDNLVMIFQKNIDKFQVK